MSQLDTVTTSTLRCSVCGHTSCIRFEEESCNYDGCPECNAAELRAQIDRYCSVGNHEWWNPRPGVRECIACGFDPDADHMVCGVCGTYAAPYKAEACGPRPTWIVYVPQHADPETGFSCIGVGGLAISKSEYDQDI